MILILKNDHKQNLSLLMLQPIPVLQDFCKLALEYIQKGPNPKLYNVAAQKLDVQVESIRGAVEGLVFLLVESCRNELSEQDFRDLVLALGFAEGHQQQLSAVYEDKKGDVRSALAQLTLREPHYRDLEWRLDVQLGSRALRQQVTPLVTMKLSLDSGRQVCLQTDPVNLAHAAEVLEGALLESRSQHSRRVARSFE
ncbi:COMM domain-containing protein 2-like isoform X2 [Bacillus rossius redtenbacheri]|uniref:COMM domain-containing protein 2-like isoform X2 n=1 Tax=Bacillus rossius redtenbacheri TaxID=93214 RepID=UPI002FDD6950